jgi:hypothetical protein
MRSKSFHELHVECNVRRLHRRIHRRAPERSIVIRMVVRTVRYSSVPVVILISVSQIDHRLDSSSISSSTIPREQSKVEIHLVALNFAEKRTGGFDTNYSNGSIIET